MNTNDFKPFDYYQEKNPWETIFTKQREIFLRFMEVEGYENFAEYDFDINTLIDQELFKEFMNRVIEELCEATLDVEHNDHFVEEIVDALNFLVETYLIYGWTEKDLPPWETSAARDGFLPNISLKNTRDLKANTYTVIEKICATNNLLKNRKWKQTQYLVDLLVFEERFKDVWELFNEYVNWLGISEQLLFSVWSQKFQTNYFRAMSAY